MAEITFEIVEHYGVLSETPTGWSKELNLVSWNNRPAKFDLREWDEEHEKMSKGMTFTEEEFLSLQKIVSEV